MLPALAQECEKLSSLKLPDTTIATAQANAAGAFTAPGGRGMPNLPAFCRVTGSIKPSPDSDIQFEVWMPASGWNGKYQGVGNGGFAGSISYGELAGNVTKGYATASTDTGHRAGGTDAGWALDHPQKVIDFGYRAIHETAVKAKAIIGAYYGGAPKKSYFASCSNGGRQALMEAQRFPEDYDGIVAGAPANYWTHLLSEAGSDMVALGRDAASYIAASKLPAIEAATLEACDAQDGLKDGLIDNPIKCKFDPAVLLCKDVESDSCLTAPQVDTLKKLYAGPVDAKGHPLFHGHAMGGATGNAGWLTWILGPSVGKSLLFAFGSNFFTNMVFEKSDWDYHTFVTERDMKAADTKLAKTLNSTDADLKKFQSRGGKLIMYHGWSDPAIPAANAIDYYESVASKIGAKNTADFVRLYLAPGMQHCGGGPGPNSFDMSAPIERWVEAKVAPEEIIATKFKGQGASSGVERTRPLCPYPLVARYKGSGSTDDAANFSCAKDAR